MFAERLNYTVDDHLIHTLYYITEQYIYFAVLCDFFLITAICPDYIINGFTCNSSCTYKIYITIVTNFFFFKRSLEKLLKKLIIVDHAY